MKKEIWLFVIIIAMFGLPDGIRFVTNTFAGKKQNKAACVSNMEKIAYFAGVDRYKCPSGGKYSITHDAEPHVLCSIHGSGPSAH